MGDTNYGISSQYTQNQIKPGEWQGDVVDDRDPEGRNRVKVWVYGLYGDFNKRKLNALPWAETSSPPGSVPRYKLFDLVTVAFIGGDFDQPVVKGKWHGNPSAEGTLPRNRKFGTDLPTQAWGHRGDGTPETHVVAHTPEGSSISIEEKQLEENTLSTIELQDAGNKFIRIKSFHDGKAPSADKSKTNPSEDLYKKDLPEIEPLLTGLETELEENTAGSIEISTPNSKRIIISDDEDFSLDSMSQKNEDEEWDLELKSIAGEVFSVKQGSAVLAMGDSSTSIQGPLFATNLMSLPELWTSEDE